MVNRKKLLKKGFIVLMVALLTLVVIPQKGEAAYSTITSSKNVNYSMDIVKTDIKYNVFKNAPYNLPNSTLVSDSVNFIGSKYQAVKEVVTDNSRTWVNFKDLNGTEIGWVDKNAVKQGANFRTVTASENVNYYMEIVPTEIRYNVYSSGPHNTPNSALVNNSSAYFKQKFRAVKEVETDSERTWVNFVDSTGQDVGWIDVNAVQFEGSASITIAEIGKYIEDGEANPLEFGLTEQEALENKLAFEAMSDKERASMISVLSDPELLSIYTESEGELLEDPSPANPLLRGTYNKTLYVPLKTFGITWMKWGIRGNYTTDANRTKVIKANSIKTYLDYKSPIFILYSSKVLDEYCSVSGGKFISTSKVNVQGGYGVWGMQVMRQTIKTSINAKGKGTYSVTAKAL
ncbi:SH3-like domain-containing protein [Listeria booriae]|uniref:GW domain-containing protein n=1 Tax=Listeria booriae TaxID=1552123 RepID=A0A7X1CIL6_9LIST|nr:SH3-like domain-containing protein [Listeria booriae]MBC1779005.1 hypothetical protein [Listeria booriae]